LFLSITKLKQVVILSRFFLFIVPFRYASLHNKKEKEKVQRGETNHLAMLNFIGIFLKIP
jgi:hypothetical protein